MASAALGQMGTASKAMLLLTTAVCFLMMVHGVNGGCCAVNGASSSCQTGTNAAACQAAGGAYADGPHFCRSVISGGSVVQSCEPCSPGSACGDPHIQGFDGRNYLLWGKTNTVYDILSERNHQVNVRLFSDPPPTDKSTSSTRARGHALFIDAVGILINDARITVRMVSTRDADGVEPELASIISSLPAAHRASSKKLMVVTVSAADGTKRHTVWTGKPLQQQAVDSDTSYAFKHANLVTISSSQISLTVQLRYNHHLNFQVTAIAGYWTNVHGILGQTYAAVFGESAAAAGAADDVPTNTGERYSLEGKEEDYITSDLLSIDDKFSRFVVGGSKLRVLVDDASAVSRKMLKAEAAAGNAMLVDDNNGRQAMARCNAGMVGDNW